MRCRKNSKIHLIRRSAAGHALHSLIWMAICWKTILCKHIPENPFSMAVIGFDLIILYAKRPGQHPPLCMSTSMAIITFIHQYNTKEQKMNLSPLSWTETLIKHITCTCLVIPILQTHSPSSIMRCCINFPHRGYCYSPNY